jgi:hypothetical protein
MATLAVTNPTLLDITKSMAPDGSVDVVAEILNQTNEILDDVTMIEGNLPTGHRTTVRTGIPDPTWRQLYGGVQPTKSTRVQITDSCGMLEAYAEIDKAAADLNGNTNEFRLSEDRAFIEGMGQTAALTMFQGDESLNPERFTGLNPRYNDLAAENADNIIDAGGTGTDNASLWLVGWGPNTCHGIYPKGSTAGLNVQDLGEVTVENVDGANGRMQAYRTHYRWDLGLTVRDWRYIVRICNIDRSLLTIDSSTGANLPNLMFEAEQLIPNMGAARMAWYSDRSIATKVMQQSAYGTRQSTLVWEDVGGRKTLMTPTGLPMRRTDALSADEARVV